MKMNLNSSRDDSKICVDDNNESENDDKNDDDDNDTVGQVEQTGAITRRVMSQLSTLLIISTQY